MQPMIDTETARLARTLRLRSVARVGAALALAACAALLLARGMRPPEPEQARAPVPAPAVIVQPAPVALLASVTALAGHVSATDAQGHSVTLTLDSRPTQGWTIETDADAEITPTAARHRPR